MADIQSGEEVSDVGRCRVMSAVPCVAGIAVDIALPSVSVQKLIQLPVFTSGFVADI